MATAPPPKASLGKSFVYVSQSGTAAGANILYGIVRAKLVATLIGTTGAAVIGQLTSLVNLSTFVSQAGLPTGLINEVSVARGRKDDDQAARLLSTYVLASLFLAVASSAVLFLAAPLVSRWLFFRTDLTGYVRLVAVSLVPLSLAGASATSLSAYRQTKGLLSLGMLAGLVNTIVTIALISAFGIDGVAYAVLANAVIVTGLGVAVCRIHGIPSVLAAAPRLFRLGLLGVLLKYGVVATCSSVALQMSEATTKGIIVRGSGLAAAGLYQAAANISFQYMALFLGSLGVFLLPHLAENPEPSTMASECNNALRLLLLLAAPVLLGLVVLAEWAIAILYSKAFVEAGALLALIVVGDVFKIGNKVLGTLIVARRHLGVWLGVDLSYAALIPAATQWLYPHLGLRAAPVAYALAAFLGFGAFLVAAILYDGFRLHLRCAVLLAILAGTLIGLAMTRAGLSPLACVAAVGLPLMAICGVGLSRDERRRAWGRLSRALRTDLA